MKIQRIMKKLLTCGALLLVFMVVMSPKNAYAKVITGTIKA